MRSTKGEKGYASGDISRVVSISISTPSLSSALSSASLAPHTATFSVLLVLSHPPHHYTRMEPFIRTSSSLLPACLHLSRKLQLVQRITDGIHRKRTFIGELLKRRRRQVDVVVSAYRALVDDTDVHSLTAPGDGSGLSAQGTRAFIYKKEVSGVGIK